MTPDGELRFHRGITTNRILQCIKINSCDRLVSITGPHRIARTNRRVDPEIRMIEYGQIGLNNRVASEVIDQCVVVHSCQRFCCSTRDNGISGTDARVYPHK